MALLLAAGPSTASATCTGDCNGGGAVTIDELITAVDVALGRRSPSACAGLDDDSNTALRALVTAVGNAIDGCPPLEVPTDEAQLRTWLQAGSYLKWPAESAPHRSAGPHFGTIRTFVNDPLFASLSAPAAAHPAGSIAVKELYGASGDAVQGWSVMIKLDAASDGGQGWFWYERFNTSVYAAGRGSALCTGCHTLGRDFIRIPFPLQ